MAKITRSPLRWQLLTVKAKEVNRSLVCVCLLLFQPLERTETLVGLCSVLMLKELRDVNMKQVPISIAQCSQVFSEGSQQSLHARVEQK